ncbi:hypothetical protein CMK14_07135 [Candidatus Poribacteria bacterium]|nr:hypothetical protein [Candidatus Poribacteria bacterium]
MFRIILLVSLIFNDFIALYAEGVDESTIIEPAIVFSDVTEEAGITFRHFDGRQGDRYFVETIGSGCAFLDYNNDGHLDLYLVSANNFPQSPDEDNSYDNQLYQNTGSGSFVLVAAGVEDQGYGTGVAVADYDGDGWLDLYLTNFGSNRLFRNQGDGTFQDLTQQAGVDDPRWSAGAAFADYDGDGWLDLYLTNYCDFQLADHRTCAEQGVEVYCGPEEFKGVTDRLFRNQGDGTFQDLTQQAGVHNPIGKGMSAIWSDYDNDGDPDLFVANDGTENFLYQNNNDGTFQDLAWLAGIDCDDHGNMQGSMGLDLADYDNDGYPDLLVTNFQRQLNTLYRNEGNGFFNDVSFPSGLGYSLPFVSWGTGFFDFNKDGFLDLFIVNGHIQDQIESYDSSTTYLQVDHLLINDQQNSFDRQPTLFTTPKSGRGAAFGDYDNDGDIDILVNNAHDVPTLWRNDTKSMHHWLMVKLVGQNGNRYGIGAKTKIITSAQTWSAECRAGASYMSTNDSRLYFGLGQTRSIEQVEVHWPSGLIDRIKNPSLDSVLIVVEGSTQE